MTAPTSPAAPSRRAILGWALLVGLPATAAMAVDVDVEEPDPTDLVPRRFSPEDFARLTKAELYKAALAVRRGRTITIDGCTASQSRAIILTAADDRAAAAEMLRSQCPG